MSEPTDCQQNKCIPQIQVLLGGSDLSDTLYRPKLPQFNNEARGREEGSGRHGCTCIARLSGRGLPHLFLLNLQNHLSPCMPLLQILMSFPAASTTFSSILLVTSQHQYACLLSPRHSVPRTISSQHTLPCMAVIQCHTYFWATGSTPSRPWHCYRRKAWHLYLTWVNKS